MLAGVVIWFDRGSAEQFYAAIFISIVFLLLDTALRPYYDFRCNALKTLVSTSMVITLLCGYSSKLDPEGEIIGENTLGWTLVMVNIVIVMLVLLLLGVAAILWWLLRLLLRVLRISTHWHTYSLLFIRLCTINLLLLLRESKWHCTRHKRSNTSSSWLQKAKASRHGQTSKLTIQIQIRRYWRLFRILFIFQNHHFPLPSRLNVN